MRTGLKPAIVRLLPSAGAIALAAIVAHFVFHDPPDLLGALGALPAQYSGRWSFPVDAAMGLLTVVVMWFAAFGVGHLVLHRTGAVACLPSLWSRWVFSPLVGWIILSLLVLALGLAGFAVRWALGTLLTFASVVAIRGWGLLASDLRATSEMSPEIPLEDAGSAEGSMLEPRDQVSPPLLGGYRFAGISALLIGGFYLLIVPYALTPAVESDELRYHLAAPAQWLQEGRIYRLPHQAFSNFPFQTEMLFMLAMSLQGTEGARLVHLTFLESCGILVALIAYLMIRVSSAGFSPARRGRELEIAGGMGLAFVLIPCASILGAWAFIDIAMTAYFLAVVYLAALALAGPVRPPAWLLGLMVGGAMGTKYSMAPLMLAMLTLLLVLGAWRGSCRWRGVRPVTTNYVVFAGLAGLFPLLPWLIKNLLWTGNPFYPLAYGMFGGVDWSDANAAFYASKAAEKGLRAAEMYDIAARKGWLIPLLREEPWGRILEFLLSPITTSLFPEAFEGHFLGPIPLSALALAALGGFAWLLSGPSACGRGTERFATGRVRIVLALWIIGVAAGSWLFWFLTYQSNRMLLPTLALALGAGAWGWSRLADADGATPSLRAIRGIVSAGMLYAFLHTACALIGSPPREVNFMGGTWRVGSTRFGAPLPVAFGFESPEDYVERRLEYVAAARWLNPRLTRENRVLLIGEHRTMWFAGNMMASDWFDTPQPLPLIRETRDNNALFDRLRELSVRYVFFNREELSRYAARYFVPRFTPEEFARFEAMTGWSSGQPDPRLVEIYRDPSFDIVIYEISADAATTKD